MVDSKWNGPPKNLVEGGVGEQRQHGKGKWTVSTEESIHFSLRGVLGEKAISRADRVAAVALARSVLIAQAGGESLIGHLRHSLCPVLTFILRQTLKA